MLLPLLLLAQTPILEQAQINYLRCLSGEADVAVSAGILPARFAEVVDRLCDKETEAFRAAAVAMLRREASDPDAVSEAEARFARSDAANRAALVARFEQRIRARRPAASGASRGVAKQP